MKHKLFLPTLATALVLVMASAKAYAQPTAAEIFSSFNGLNGDQGFLYNVETLGGTSNFQRLTSTGSSPDLSVYHPTTGGSDFFLTFGVQPNNTNVGSSGIAKLSYNASAGTTTNKDGVALSYGAAYLYSRYADGGLLVMEGGMANDFSTALNVLNGTIAAGNNWSSNSFLYQLRTMQSNTDYWTRAYNPGLIYSDAYSSMGNVSVFILQLNDQSGNASQQDVLYIARSTGPAAPPWDPNQPPTPSGVPEPATLLLWTLGCLGLTGTSWVRNRRMMKLAFS